MLKASALLCPRAARALSIGHGQCGHLPVEIFSGTGRAGIGNIAGGRAKAGTGTPVAHHYYSLPTRLNNNMEGYKTKAVKGGNTQQK